MLEIDLTKKQVKCSTAVVFLLEVMQKSVNAHENVVVALDEVWGALSTNWQEELQASFDIYMSSIERALSAAIREDMMTYQPTLGLVKMR